MIHRLTAIALCAALGGCAGTSPAMRFVDGEIANEHQAIRREAERQAKAVCGGQAHLRTNHSGTLPDDYTCEPSNIASSSRWSECLSHFAETSWQDYASFEGTGRRIAGRLFHDASRYCRTQGDELLATVGRKQFDDERKLNKTLFESYSVQIEEYRISEI